MKKLIFIPLIILSKIALSEELKPPHLDLQLSGFSYHLEKPNDYETNKENWNEINQGIGLQYVEPLNDKWSNKYFGGRIKDSNRFYGWYLGIGKEYNIYSGEYGKVNIGASITLMHRGVDFKGKSALILAPLPNLSFTAPEEKFGANIVIIPKVNIDQYSSPWTIFFQITTKIKDF